jgi:hypothetical protein
VQARWRPSGLPCGGSLRAPSRLAMGSKPNNLCPQQGLRGYHIFLDVVRRRNLKQLLVKH